MEEMQFAAVIVLALLLVKLLLLPRRVAVHAMVNKARWLMVGGTGLLLAHFALHNHNNRCHRTDYIQKTLLLLDFRCFWNPYGFPGTCYHGR